MLDDQETYKHLKTDPTAPTTQDVNEFVYSFLKAKRSQKKQALDWKTPMPQHPSCMDAKISKRKHCPTTNSLFQTPLPMG